MPYIKKEDREVIDPLLESVLKIPTASAGNCNYVITRFLSTVMDSNSYDGINEIIGVLECAKLEFYRRIAAPYEEKKLDINGDVY